MPRNNQLQVIATIYKYIYIKQKQKKQKKTINQKTCTKSVFKLRFLKLGEDINYFQTFQIDNPMIVLPNLQSVLMIMWNWNNQLLLTRVKEALKGTLNLKLFTSMPLPSYWIIRGRMWILLSHLKYPLQDEAWKE